MSCDGRDPVYIVGELTNVKYIYIIVCHTKDYLSNDQQGQLARRYLRFYFICKIPDVVQKHFLLANCLFGTSYTQGRINSIIVPPSLGKAVLFKSRSWPSVLETTLCDKVCQWIAAGRRFFGGVNRFSPPIKLTATI